MGEILSGDLSRALLANKVPFYSNLHCYYSFDVAAHIYYSLRTDGRRVMDWFDGVKGLQNAIVNGREDGQIHPPS